MLAGTERQCFGASPSVSVVSACNAALSREPVRMDCYGGTLVSCRTYFNMTAHFALVLRIVVRIRASILTLRAILVEMVLPLHCETGCQARGTCFVFALSTEKCVVSVR